MAAYKRLEFCRSSVMLTSEHAGAKNLYGRESKFKEASRQEMSH